MESSQLKNIVEAALLAAGRPLAIEQFVALFGEQDPPEKKEIRECLAQLQAEYEGRGIEIREVASGFRVQVRDALSPWLSKLWEERPPRYSRALMETLAIVAYRQPVTRGDIEEIRGVAVTSNIIRTLLERDWIKVVGHRDVPGKPAMFGTTRGFLDYFGLKKLDDLPPLAELATLEPVSVQLEIEGTNPDAPPFEDAAASDEAEVAEAGDEVSASDELDDVVAAEEAAAEDAAEEAADESAASGDSTDGSTDENDTAQDDRPPGSVKPLVGLNAPGAEPPALAEVVPLKKTS